MKNEITSSTSTEESEAITSTEKEEIKIGIVSDQGSI